MRQGSADDNVVSKIHAMFEAALEAARHPDGGFGSRAGFPSDPEPTALAAIALDDAEARSWLGSHQRGDGHLALGLGDVENVAATPLAAFALEGPARERALDAVVETRAGRFGSTAVMPFDEDARGWPWTRGAFGWVEPTARSLLALRVLRPAATTSIAEGISMLADRECVGGGWNYGNRVVLNEELPPFAQTTAIAVLALSGVDADGILDRGISRLRELWRMEGEGGLSLALATAALRANHDRDHVGASDRLGEVFAATRFLGDVVAVAWASIATGPGLERMVASA